MTSPDLPFSRRDRLALHAYFACVEDRMTSETLTACERIDVDRVLLSATVVGWLRSDQQLQVVPQKEEVLVYSSGSGPSRQRSYPRTPRWIFEFLHDLAHGYWTASIEQHDAMSTSPPPSP